ncbi:FadR family transcriptional regulator [Tsukamurella tyrosinosolvens]|uniref:DNA-binding transcriptional regulator, FadR family n=1 Tax=Tsukamurella tyrosinosolvens TaxID=57704 RepID=A0A1H4PND1_TSUTY|nr:FadR/GntR family transcriptional regulator [Tsukamurella tyrosinosolvens]AUN39681.1 GntR family transcriptional regulator [Tsukamurella tyrosinosolvens]KXO97403.1 GntR family transcriptional regulator [Tsukamurella tyrosinosolvens]KXP08910.1 GntR family transcriptional regulator [Tsukamurella tyrosinosolvens]KZL97138.1 GntR family transcriptional regulator [Tsukamurella tyrosinosolvens]MCA4996973.1 FadR family transcriptional regulator [Tsukamurella tyrosinosolvens]
MPPLRRTSLADQAADALLARVRSGEWAVGDKLPGETTLAPQLGVGRSTVREAIRRLAGIGVLATRQGAGVFVTRLDAPSGLDVLLDGAAIDAVLEARIAVEVEAATLAARRRTEEDLDAVRAALAIRAAHRADLVRHVETDTDFHRAVIAAAHNPVLLEMFDGIAAHLRRAMIDMLRTRDEDFGGDDDQLSHAALLAAIEHRDADAAARLSREHLAGMLTRRDAH